MKKIKSFIENMSMSNLPLRGLFKGILKSKNQILLLGRTSGILFYFILFHHILIPFYLLNLATQSFVQKKSEAQKHGIKPDKKLS